ncbi:MAG: hypothetical protein BGO98_48015 [Myxococcales bacterium 68-20]|nr:MAG: hypothetical protein BGO98_48015 [Myxococcales bacterium 68-20]
MGRLASSGSWTALALAASVACNDSATTSFAGRQERERESTRAAPRGSADRDPACTPDVSGLVPAEIAPIEIDCPRGYTHRKSLAALPIAGRFTNSRELTEAFCIAESDMGADASDADEKGAAVAAPLPPSVESAIDFATNDVIAYAFDAHAGAKPMLYERGDELWLRLMTSSCTGEAPELASVAYVVPKDREINEQRCSLSCR